MITVYRGGVSAGPHCGLSMALVPLSGGASHPLPGSLACGEAAYGKREGGSHSKTEEKITPAQQVGELLLYTSRERSRDAPLSSLPATHPSSGPTSSETDGCLCLYCKGHSIRVIQCCGCPITTYNMFTPRSGVHQLP
jgi:hypothetical protein